MSKLPYSTLRSLVRLVVLAFEKLGLGLKFTINTCQAPNALSLLCVKAIVNNNYYLLPFLLFVFAVLFTFKQCFLYLIKKTEMHFVYGFCNYNGLLHYQIPNLI